MLRRSLLERRHDWLDVRGWLIAVTLILVSSCASTGERLVITGADGDRIPTTIGVYPLVSEPVQGPAFIPKPLSLRVEKDRIYISPPTEVKLAVTSQSQILTGLITTGLAGHGFDLRELPVEVPENSEGKNTVFVISMELLDELRTNYGLQAILIGDAFFARTPGAPPETRVTFAHLKLVDIATLEVLCQLTLPFDEYGERMDRLAQAVTTRMATMAGLAE